MSLSIDPRARPLRNARAPKNTLEAVDILRGKDTMPATGQHIRTTNRTVFFGFTRDLGYECIRVAVYVCLSVWVKPENMTTIQRYTPVRHTTAARQ